MMSENDADGLMEKADSGSNEAVEEQIWGYLL